jgi:4-diphosphocytidyl-2-C-methyl-D-erythritol kinase
MVPTDLADEVVVEVEAGRDGEVTCRVRGRPELDGPSNLAARAAEAFRRRFGAGDAVAISIAKRIPVTAGLGGGSSDAAAVIRALARAHGVRDRAALAEVALEIGSDVPFFLGPGPAWGTARGERLRPARVPTLHLVLSYPRDPGLAIRAGDAYRWLDASRRTARDVPAPRGSGRPFSLQNVWNDLQEPCFAHHPPLRTILDALVGQGASAAIMSGSGPTVFGIFADRASARRAARAAERLGSGSLEVFVVRTLQRHPGVSRWKSPRFASSRSTRRS